MEAVKEYKTIKKLALDIKLAINSYLSRTTFGPLDKILSREELKEFLGKTLDNEKNRKKSFSGGVVKTFRDTIFAQTINGPKRKALFVELLIEYNREVYAPLLEDLLRELKKG
jgi:hypothetical protein